MRRAVVAALACALAVTAAGRALATPTPRNPEPVLAYYYIWFDEGSWDRAKTDYPLLGRYSSDDVSVLRRHVRTAKAAGIDGFIVSWKSTPTLDRRLAKLVRVAEAEHFALAIIYQGLDFFRRPLPAKRIAHDLDVFVRRYAGSPVFRLFRKPVVIWSGSWEFSPAEVSSVTNGRRDRLLILASEKNEQGYRRLSSLVDGDAYYWSSVDPTTYPSYPSKLVQLGELVHARKGLWIAPAAPGFDARLVGGMQEVPRLGGTTLRREVDGAVESSPDAIGLISWNEFSENSHVEPSIRFGRRYLDVLSDIVHANLGNGADGESSEAVGGVGYGLPILSGLVGVVFAALLVAFTRRHVSRSRRPSPNPTGGGPSP